MQIPKRKAGEFSQQKADPYITQNKVAKLEAELNRLIKVVRPRAMIEVSEHAKLGDFSENAAYQIAKGKLRAINGRILEIEELLRTAIIIDNKNNNERVRLGCTVTVECNGKQKTYTILGSQETDPAKGTISHLSPIGAALIGNKLNEEVEVEINNRPIKYKIIKIS